MAAETEVIFCEQIVGAAIWLLLLFFYPSSASFIPAMM